MGNLSWGLSALPSPSCPGHLGPRQGSPGAKPHPPARVLFSRPLNFTAQGPEFSVPQHNPAAQAPDQSRGREGGEGEGASPSIPPPGGKGGTGDTVGSKGQRPQGAQTAPCLCLWSLSSLPRPATRPPDSLLSAFLSPCAGWGGTNSWAPLGDTASHAVPRKQEATANDPRPAPFALGLPAFVKGTRFPQPSSST